MLLLVQGAQEAEERSAQGDPLARMVVSAEDLRCEMPARGHTNNLQPVLL